MRPLRLIETTPGSFRLELIAGTTDVHAIIEELGHEPNGPFWEGIATPLIRTQAPDLDERFFFDSEGGAFCANGRELGSLERLAELMSAVATDDDRLRELVALAASTGFEFDD